MKNRKSIRLQKWNYAWSGHYFVTICSQNRECIFGEINNGNMVLNNSGQIINEYWNKLPDKYNIELNEYITMPNHFHGILKIQNDSKHGRENPAPTNTQTNPTLGNIIGLFKYQTTKQINELKRRGGVLPPDVLTKIWQRNYYEHIIRNEKEFKNIQQYIIQNMGI